MSAHFTDANFEAEVVKSELPVLIDFYADWCGPCKMMAPSIDKLAEEYKDRVKIGKMNVEENEKGNELMIQSIPTIAFYKGGQIVHREVGYKSEEDLRKMIETHLLK